VPKPSAGMRPAPWLSGILDMRRSEDSIMIAPRGYFASGSTAQIQKSDAGWRRLVAKILRERRD
jgi:hypothetical protein